MRRQFQIRIGNAWVECEFEDIRPDLVFRVTENGNELGIYRAIGAPKMYDDNGKIECEKLNVEEFTNAESSK